MITDSLHHGSPQSDKDRIHCAKGQLPTDSLKQNVRVVGEGLKCRRAWSTLSFGLTAAVLLFLFLLLLFLNIHREFSAVTALFVDGVPERWVAVVRNTRGLHRLWPVQRVPLQRKLSPQAARKEWLQKSLFHPDAHSADPSPSCGLPLPRPQLSRSNHNPNCYFFSGTK